MEAFNQFMQNTNNLAKPSTATELDLVLSNLTGIQLLFALNYIYKTADLSDRNILRLLLSSHKQRLNNENNISV